MNEDTQRLYQQIQVYMLDQPDTCLTFHKRLARENNWSKHYTERVISEYKKLALLAAVAGHKVTHSDQVDQAWHLHLINSRGYWNEFCPRVLGKPLHHEPSRGGQVEQEKFVDWYQKTLDSYERIFGYLPPADIWPASDQRFSNKVRFIRVNTQQHWLIPKPIGLKIMPVWRPMSILPLLLILAVISGCAAVSPLLMGSSVTAGVFLGLAKVGLEDLLNIAPMNFLLLYIHTGFAMMLIAAGLKAYWLKSFEPVHPQPIGQPSIEALAYLAGGSDRVIHTALVALIERGTLAISPDKNYLELISDEEPQTPMEREIIYGLKHSMLLLNRQEIKALSVRLKQGSSLFKEVKNSLVDQGLLIPPAKTDTIPNKIGLLFTPLFLIGLVRLIHGLHIGHPVGFLFLLLILVGISPLFFTVSSAKRTAYGNEILAEHKHSLSIGESTIQPALSYAIAISGLAALSDTAFAEVGLALLNTKGNDREGDNDGCGGCGGCGG
ncbi:MAG: TIGR04222 domain-containing membrane protein [Methylococcales bacterium]